MKSVGAHFLCLHGRWHCRSQGTDRNESPVKERSIEQGGSGWTTECEKDDKLCETVEQSTSSAKY